MPRILQNTRNTARKTVVLPAPKQGYKPSAQEQALAEKRAATVAKKLENETRVDVKFTNLSLQDLAILEEALKAMESRYRVSAYGLAYGGKAKDMNTIDAMVQHKRAQRLLAKVRKADAKFAK